MSFKVKKPIEQPEKKSDSFGYKHLFKQPDEPEQKPIEKHYRGWDEYEKEQHPSEVEEARIIDPNSKVDLYYVTPKGARQKVFQSIPQRMLDKAIMVLRNKYPQIKDTDIEMRPSSYNDYSQLDEFAPGDNGRSDDDQFFQYAKMWYNGDFEVQSRIEELLAKDGWEIGELESEEGGAFIVQSGDEDGDTYMGWSREELSDKIEESVDYLDE